MKSATLPILVVAVVLLATTRPVCAKKATGKTKEKTARKEAAEAKETPPASAAQSSKPSRATRVNTGSLDGKVEQLAVCGLDFSHILVLTSHKDLFHTTNFGESWASKKSEMDDRHSARKVQIVSMFQDNLDHNKVIFFDRTGEHLITSDCGVNYDRLAPAGLNLTSVFFHPLNSSTMAALDTNRSLHLTKDNGKTWTKLADNILDFNFAKYSESAYFASKDRLFAIQESVGKDGRPVFDLVYSDDLMAKTTVILPGAEQFILTRCCVFAKQGAADWKVSEAFGWSYNFYNTSIFDKDLRHLQNLRVLDNDVTWYPMTALEYHRNGLELNKLAKGDYWGTSFQVLEPNLVCQKQVGSCDFLPLHGLMGVSVLNRFDPEYTAFRVDLPKFMWQSMDPILDFESLSDFRQTLISFNFGEKYRPIPAPTHDHEGNRLECDGCHLHLHLFSSKQFFSLPKANLESPGVIIASGSVGKYLVEEDDGKISTGVFVSENAGFDWRMVAAGAHVFEILDRGSLILLAKAKTPTTTLRYSLDLGRTFGELEISSEAVEVVAITANEKQFLRKAVVVARRRTAKGFVNSLLTVDFSNIVERECVFDKNNPEGGDYMEWRPSSDTAGGCWNGREVALNIKRPAAKCFNPRTFTSWSVKRYCECTEADFHCDFGFFRNDKNECVKIDPLVASDQPPTICKGTYYLRSGYKKNLESFCSGGVDHAWVEQACPQGMLSGLGGLVWGLAKWTLAIAVVYGVLASGGLGFVLEAKDKVLKKLRKIQKARVYKSKEYCELKKNDMAVEPPRRQNGYSEVKKDMNSIFEDDEDDGAVQMQN